MDLDKDLTCTICNKTFENPVLLTCCEENVCKEHIDALESSKIQRCPLCSESLPKQKLPINKVLKNLIDNRKIQNFSIDSEYKDVLKSLKQKVKTIEGMCNDPEGFINERFLELRNQVDLDRETIKLEVDNLAEGLIKSLKTYEKDLKRESKSLGKSMKCNELIKTANDQMADYEKSLKTFNDIDRKNKIEHIKESISLLDKTIEKYEKNLFKNQLIKYEPTKADLIKSDFGKLNWSLMSGKLVKTLTGLMTNVMSLVSIGNGNLAWGSADCKIRIWNVNDENMRQTLEENLGYMFFSNQAFPVVRIDNDCLVCGSINYNAYLLKIWSIKEGRVIRTLEGHNSITTSLAYRKKGFLASGSSLGEISLWSVSESRLVQTLLGHDCCVKALIFLENGCLASASADGMIKIWDVKTLSLLTTLKDHSGSVNSLICLKNGCLASGSSDCTIKLWDTNEGVLMRTLRGHISPVNALALLDNDLLASGYADGRIGIWNVKYDSLIKLFEAPEAHSNSVNALVVLENGYLVSGSDDRTIKIWDI